MNTNTLKALALGSFLLILFALIGLGTRKPQAFNRSFYHWKSRFERGTYSSIWQDSFLNRHQVKKLYVKMLDVDYTPANGIIPVSKTYIEHYHAHDSMEYVPVVYITNLVLKHLTEADVKKFAEHFITHAMRLQTYVPTKIKEIQVDCDWTQETQKVYFQLLTTMKQLLPTMKYSVTLRLYAFRYPDKMGVPPVDKVVLMLYNMGNARDYTEGNSIFNYTETLKYIKGKKGYVLPMDFALPIFSWTCHYRYNRLIGIFSGISDESFNQYHKYMKQVKPGIFLVTAPFTDYVNNKTSDFRPGDIIKIEKAGMSELEQAKRVALRLGMNSQSTVILFDLDEDELKKFTYEEFNKVWGTNF